MIKVYLLILIVALITLVRLQEIQIYRKTQLSDYIHFEIIWQGTANNCWVSQAGYLFQVPNCHLYQTGDILNLSGRVESLADNNNDSVNSAAIQSISVIMPSQSSVKYWFAEILARSLNFRSQVLIFWRQIFGFPSGSLLFSLVLGGRAALPEEMSAQLDDLGLSYLFSASGMHVGLLLQSVAVLTKNRSTHLKFATNVLAICAYGSLTLWRPAIVRASLMAFTRGMAQLVWFRSTHPLLNLIWAFLISLIIYPLWWLDVSFWLSYCASAALITYSLLSRRQNSFLLWEIGQITAVHQPDCLSWWSRMHKYTRETLTFSLIAQLATLPIMLQHFDRISYFGLIASWAVLWVVPTAFKFGLVCLVCSSQFWLFSLQNVDWVITMLKAALLPIRLSGSLSTESLQICTIPTMMI